MAEQSSRTAPAPASIRRSSSVSKSGAVALSRRRAAASTSGGGDDGSVMPVLPGFEGLDEGHPVLAADPPVVDPVHQRGGEVNAEAAAPSLLDRRVEIGRGRRARIERGTVVGDL